MNTHLSTSTVAVIVSFNPDLDILQTLLVSLAVQCPVVIVDNGSQPAVMRPLEALVLGIDSVELIKLQENTGIAHAQNTAIRNVFRSYKTAKYILTLDHDSIPAENLVAFLEKTFATIERQGNRVAAVGPMLYDPRNDKLLKFHKMKLFSPGKINPREINGIHSPVEVDGLNSSGTLISVEALRIIGEFDSRLFIDHVETDWCFRARASGFKLFATAGTRLTHHMGDAICHYWFFGRKSMPYRSPSRHYYLTRNSILLQKRNYVPVAWKFANILKLGFTFLYFGFLGKDTKQQRKCILLGMRDGMKGITGRSAACNRVPATGKAQ